MSRDKKRQLNMYQVNDSEAMARHLEKMAARGWHLEKADNWGWRFQRGEPQAVHYAVTYFPDASIFDALPTGGQEAYFGYCQAAGWEYVSSYGPIQYFRNKKPDPVPIETDEGEKLRTVHRSMKKTLIFGHCLLILVEGFSLWTRWDSFRRSPMSSLGSNSALSLVLLLAGFLLYLVGILADYFVWYFQSKRSVARGGPCAKVHTKARMWAGWVLLAVGAVEIAALLAELANPAMRPIFLYSFGGMALSLAGTWGVLWLMKKRGCSRQATRRGFIVVCVVLALLFSMSLVPFARHIAQSGIGKKVPVYTYTDSRGWTWDILQDPLPVTLEDLGYAVTEADHCSYELESERSPLAAYTLFSQRALSRESSLEGFSVQVCVIPWGWLREWCWHSVLDSGGRYRAYDQVLEPAPTGVLEARRTGDGEHWALLCGDRVLRLDAGWVLTEGELETIVQRLSAP